MPSTNTDVWILSSLHILLTSLSLVSILILCRSTSLVNLKPRNLTLLVNWLRKFLKPSSLILEKMQPKRSLSETTVHHTLKGRLSTLLIKSLHLLDCEAIKAFTGKGLIITTSLFGGPPPKGSLTWGGRTKGSQSGRSPTNSPLKPPTGTTHRRNRGKLPSYSFTFPPTLCLHQPTEHSKGREAKVFPPELENVNIRPVDSQHCEG